MKRVAVPIVVVCAALSGCGGGSTTTVTASRAAHTDAGTTPAPADTGAATTGATGSAASPAGATTSPTASTRPTSGRAADAATVSRAALQLTDLPAGWRPYGSGSAVDTDGPCPASKLSRRTRTAKGGTTDFDDDMARAGGAVLAFRSDAAAQAYVDESTGTPGSRCLATRIHGELVAKTKGLARVTIGDATAAPAVRPAVGDDSRLVVLRVGATEAGRETDLEYAVSITRIGRFVTGVVTYEVGAADRASIIEAAAHRLQGALAGG